VFAVYGDFGTANDVCQPDLVAKAAAGAFDSVLHVGDWACACATEKPARVPPTA
jgi:hypothetical protein